MAYVPDKIGRYDVIKRIGQGGMGAVYLALDPSLQRQVVIKYLTSEFEDNEELRARFRQEAMSAARVRHRNVVTIYDVGEDEGTPFIAMEYVQGETLGAIIKRRARLALRQKLEYIAQVCDGLKAAHTQGIIHRDIKPANIMVDDEGTIKILDFGIAHVVGSGLTRPGVMMGTLSYMSPEQVTGASIDHRSDIFAVGAVTYELLAYRQAFSGGLDTGVMHRLVHDSPEPLTAIVPGIDRQIDSIVTHCLEKDPARRYQDLGSMRSDLDRAIARLGENDDRSEDTAVTVVAARPQPVPRPEPKTDIPLQTVAIERSQPDATVMDTVVDWGTRYFPPADEKAPSDELPEVQLVISPGGRAGLGDRTFKITQPITVIGRSATCDLVLSDGSCSQRHASIEYADGGFSLTDLGSQNGTYLNGRAIDANVPKPLFFGAKIELGRTPLRFSYLKDTKLPDLVGARLTPRYTLTRLLRDSEKSAFYAAMDGNVQLEVAVKIFSPELARHPTYEEHFKHEARIAAQLEDPHICRLLDSGVGEIVLQDGRRLRTPYLCYQLMSGGNLADRLDDGGHIDIGDVSRWTRSIGEALIYAHGKGVIHGDLKPTAIVFNTGGVPFLTDFAVAQRAGPVEGRPTIGWPEYMAPEQWEGGTATGATDQFALAALLYHLVAGAVPFVGQDNRQQRENNFRRVPDAAHQEAADNGRQGVSPALSDTLRRALQVDPDRRFKTMQEFVDAVVPLLRLGIKPKPRHDVFLSYDRELSGAWAKQLADRLTEKDKLRVFMDTTGLDRAGSFPPRIAAAIESSEVFVCFLASRTLESRWVRTEIRTAHESHRTMIPVFQESFAHGASEGQDPAVDALIDSQGVKLYDRSMDYIDEAIARVAKLVTKALAEEV